MCHQTVGLIARQLEAAGIPTVMLTSARDITESVNPPRAVFLDYPLGHTAGRVGEAELNRVIVSAALAMLREEVPGEIIDLPYHWGSTDDWKDKVMQVEVDSSGAASTDDDRIERLGTPQYQSDADAAAAVDTHRAQDGVVREGVDY